MAETEQKAEVVPVKKEVARTEPRHLLNPIEDMERLFEDFFPRSLLRQYKHGFPTSSELAAPFEGQMPKVDIIDRDNEIFIRAELARCGQKRH